MEDEVFKIIEEKITFYERKRDEYLEVDKNNKAEKYNKLFHQYRKILDLMIDGQMYKDLKEKRKEK